MSLGLVGLVSWTMAAGIACAQPLAARVDGAAALRAVTTLSTPEWQGRRLFTPGFEKATDWAAARLREWKLEPAGERGTFFQDVAVTGEDADFVWTAGMPALVVGARTFSFKEGDFVVDKRSTAAGEVTAAAVFAGYGISAPERGLDEYAGIDVAGRIVFLLRGSPKDAPPDTTDFPPDPPSAAGPPEPWTAESADEAKVLTAYRKGAAAVVLCEADPEARRARPWPGTTAQPSPFTRPFLVVAAMDPRVLRGVMLRDEEESLVGYVDRMNRLRRAIQQKSARSETAGVRVRVKGFDEVTIYREALGNTHSRNVLAKIAGVDPVLSRQAVVIGAHVDHLGYRNGLVHPGADDNASGSAVVLEVARTLASAGFKPRRTIVFALWCGEEEGHYGSKRFAAAPPDGLSMDRVVAYINMDMVGLGTGFDVMGARDFPAVFSLMMRDQLPEIARLARPDLTGPGGSDYAAFVAAGVETVALFSSGGSGHPDYHDAADVASKVQPDLLASVGQWVMQAAATVANETGTPLPSADRRVTGDSIRFAAPDLAGRADDGWRTLPAASPQELLAAVIAAARQQGKEEEAGRRQAADLSTPPVFVGVKAGAVAGNPALLAAAFAALGAGRLDVPAADESWSAPGGIPPEARATLRAAEQAGAVVNLIGPAPALASDLLAASTRPILVTGTTAADAELARLVKSRGSVFAVSCSGDQVESCAAGLGSLRAALGGSANLLVSMRPARGGSTAASRALYRELAQRGWSKPEIYAVAGQEPDGEPGGNLARLIGK